MSSDDSGLGGVRWPFFVYFSHPSIYSVDTGQNAAWQCLIAMPVGPALGRQRQENHSFKSVHSTIQSVGSQPARSTQRPRAKRHWISQHLSNRALPRVCTVENQTTKSREMSQKRETETDVDFQMKLPFRYTFKSIV